MGASEAVTKALPSQGLKIEIAPDASGVAGDFGEIGDIDQTTLSLPDVEEEFLDIKSNSAPGGALQRTPANRRTTGPTSFSVFFDPTNAVQIAMMGYRKNRTKVHLRVTNPTSSWTTVSDGWLQKCAVKMTDGAQMLEVIFNPQAGEKSGTFA